MLSFCAATNVQTLSCLHAHHGPSSRSAMSSSHIALSAASQCDVLDACGAVVHTYALEERMLEGTAQESIISEAAFGMYNNRRYLLQSARTVIR